MHPDPFQCGLKCVRVNPLPVRAANLLVHKAAGGFHTLMCVVQPKGMPKSRKRYWIGVPRPMEMGRGQGCESAALAV